MDAQKVLAQLQEEKAFMAMSVRISRNSYHQLNELADRTGHKPAQLMRAILEQGITDLLQQVYHEETMELIRTPDHA